MRVSLGKPTGKPQGHSPSRSPCGSGDPADGSTRILGTAGSPHCHLPHQWRQKAGGGSSDPLGHATMGAPTIHPPLGIAAPPQERYPGAAAHPAQVKFSPGSPPPGPHSSSGGSPQPPLRLQDGHPHWAAGPGCAGQQARGHPPATQSPVESRRGTQPPEKTVVLKSTTFTHHHPRSPCYQI